jgi:hypothetical protein
MSRTAGMLRKLGNGYLENVATLESVVALNFRLTQQEHWEQAAAVHDGRLPRIDPDGAELERLDEGLRIYGLHEAYGSIEGRQALLSQRLVKSLSASGLWESELVVEYYQHVDGPVVAVVAG